MVQPFRFGFELNYEKLAYWTPKGPQCLSLGMVWQFLISVIVAWLVALYNEACPLHLRQSQKNTFYDVHAFRIGM